MNKNIIFFQKFTRMNKIKEKKNRIEAVTK